jgi:hypothetical protein
VKKRSCVETEITIFSKSGGALSKRIRLGEDGLVKSDASACVMAQGVAQRFQFAGVQQFARLIEEMRSNQALALGALRAGVLDEVKVVTKQKLNGIKRPDTIARTANFLVYQNGRPALALLDHDVKGMPVEVALEVKRLGGFWAALASVQPELRTAARVSRRSTSAGLYRDDTGERLPGSDGWHIYVVVADGADVVRFLKTLHARCWLAGLGWLIVSVSGQLLERSIIDRMVGAPERLVFEGAPVLEPPLQQEPRRATAVEGDVLDSATACPPLTVAETSRLHELKAKAAHLLASEAAKVRAEFVKRQAKHLAERTGQSLEAAARVITRQCDGILLPDVVLPFDDAELADRTVADVLADPHRFEGATLADPLEGVDYGKCVARIMLRPDGTPWIHSFAHGRTVYELKLDGRAVRAAMEQADDAIVIKTFIDLVVNADLSDVELEELRNLAAGRSGIGKRTITSMLKAARQGRTALREQEERRRRLVERCDPRPLIGVPAWDAPFLPQMATLNEVIGSSVAARPPVRDIDGVMTRARKLAVPGTHAFTDANADQEEE